MNHDCQEFMREDEAGNLYCPHESHTTKKSKPMNLDQRAEELGVKVAMEILNEIYRINPSLKSGSGELGKVHIQSGFIKDALLSFTQESERELQKELVAQIIESRNNYCPCCHARLDEICGPCKFCKDSKNHLDTERSMYRAWRKRAEQSEKELQVLKESEREFVRVLNMVNDERGFILESISDPKLKEVFVEVKDVLTAHQRRNGGRV